MPPPLPFLALDSFSRRSTGGSPSSYAMPTSTSLKHSVQVTLSVVGHELEDTRSLVLVENKPFSIGRASKSRESCRSSPSNALFNCAVVSRYHAELELRRDQNQRETVIIRDTRSMHGTRVNGLPLRRGEERRLTDGAVIQLGEKVTRGDDSHDQLNLLFQRPIPPLSQLSNTFASSRPRRAFCVPVTSDEEDISQSSEAEISIVSVGKKHTSSAMTTPETPRVKPGSSNMPILLDEPATPIVKDNVASMKKPITVELDSDSDVEEVRPSLPPRTTAATSAQSAATESIMIIPDTFNDDDNESLYRPGTPNLFRYDDFSRARPDSEPGLKDFEGESHQPEEVDAESPSDVGSEELGDYVDYESLQESSSPELIEDELVDDDEFEAEVDELEADFHNLEAEGNELEMASVGAQAEEEEEGPELYSSKEPTYQDELDNGELPQTDHTNTLATSRKRIEGEYLQHFGQPLPEDPPTFSWNPFDPSSFAQPQASSGPSITTPNLNYGFTLQPGMAPCGTSQIQRIHPPNYPSFGRREPSSLGIEPDFNSPRNAMPTAPDNLTFGRPPQSGNDRATNYASPGETGLDGPVFPSAIGYFPLHGAPEPNAYINHLPKLAMNVFREDLAATQRNNKMKISDIVEHTNAEEPTQLTSHTTTSTNAEASCDQRCPHVAAPSLIVKLKHSAGIERSTGEAEASKAKPSDFADQMPEEGRMDAQTKAHGHTLTDHLDGSGSPEKTGNRSGKKRKADEMMLEDSILETAFANEVGKIVEEPRELADEAGMPFSKTVEPVKSDSSMVQPEREAQPPPRRRRRIAEVAKVTAGALVGSAATMAFLCSPLAERAIEWLA